MGGNPEINSGIAASFAGYGSLLAMTLNEVQMKKNAIKNPNGFLLISCLVVISTLTIIVSFYLNAIIQEVKISHITGESPQAYYLAEAGVQEAIWKLQNDPEWRNNFETIDNWSAAINRDNVLGATGSYAVTVANQALANAVIIATSTIPVRDTQSQRVVRTNVFKALNPTPVDGVAVFTNGQIKSTASEVNITGGDLFANDDVELRFFSDWTVSGSTSSATEVDVSVSSNLETTAVHDEDNPPIPNEILMPEIDFDSASETSYKSRADQIYSSGQFSQLLNDSPVATLDGITYVTGNVNIKKGQTLIINGTLAADGTITVGNGFSPGSTPATLDINHAVGEPSGLLAKGNISIGSFASNVTIDGLMYSGATFRLQDGALQNVNFNINGGIIARNVDLYSLWHPLNINLNQVYINESLGEPLFSQVLLINHWEEEY